jgi:exodeoxyribonuclease-3
MTWNIKTGGIDHGGIDHGGIDHGGIDHGDADRLGAIEAVVDRARPDLLALQELRGFERRMPAFAGALGLVPQLARSVFGQPVAVLVRPPLEIVGRAAVTWRLHHAAAEVTVATDAGPLTVVSTHLNSFSAERRRREAVWLAARYARRGLVILAGDLNSLSPGTVLAPDALPPAYRRRHLEPDGTVNTLAMEAFARAGFADVWQAAGDGWTVPTTRGGGHEFARTRLDYVLAVPPLVTHVREARVIRGDETEYASDHYPLLVELDLTNDHRRR